MKLLQELSAQVNLSKSDGSTAGSTDVLKKGDIKFSNMRYAINTDGEVSGSAVADYLEKAHELNDTVETVLYGLETADGDIVKVYVNAQQADRFEEEMKKLLGMEDDIEDAINNLAVKFDIVDVVWPKDKNQEDDTETDDIGTADIGDPGADDPLDDGGIAEPDDDLEVIASVDDEVDSAAEDDEADSVDDEDPLAEPEPEPEEERPSKKDKKGDKHQRLKGVGRNMKVAEDITYPSSQGAQSMSIGTRFVDRVLSEASEEDRDGVIDGFNIPLDSQQRALASKLKWKLPKQIIALFALVGVPGVRLNTEGTEKGVLDAAEMLRSNMTIRRAFLDFYKAFATAKGTAIVKEAKLKRGNYLQKMLETVLVKLGLPEELVSTTGPSMVAAALFRASKVLEDDANLKEKLRMLAVRMGINAAGVVAPLEEAVDPNGADLYADAVMELVAALGVPDTAFARNARMLLAKSFRDMRGDVNVGTLTALVKGMTLRFNAAKTRATH